MGWLGNELVQIRGPLDLLDFCLRGMQVEPPALPQLVGVFLLGSAVETP